MSANTPKQHPQPLSEQQKTELIAWRDAFNSLLMKIMDETGNYSAKLDLLEVWPETNNLAELYEQLDDLKACLDSFRPFNVWQIQNLQEAYDTQYTYASNRIEGNTLTLQETSFVINEGLTISNKSMKEHLEAINHKEAIVFVRELATNQEVLDERNIKLIHALILHGIDRENAGAYRKVSVGISGTDIVFPEPFAVANLMQDLMHYYESNKDKLHPVQLAAHMHSKLVNIHPFIDGNGRTCRLLMNLILLQHGYPITIFSPEAENRERYFNALNEARDHDDESVFERFVAENVKHWIIQYLDMVAYNIGDEEKEKGYYFFKKIAPYLKKIGACSL